jgi:Zn-dependent peptidase ImmA (M78 family)/DNA-binding XRE family transcriptional regulator
MIGKRIKQARMATGLSLRALAKQVGVSAQAISKYERGLDIPSSGVLLRLAVALDVKVEYFFRMRRVSLRTPAWRKRSSLPSKMEKSILSQAQDWLERYLEVEDLFPDRTDVSPASEPLKNVKGPVCSLDEAEKKADELRTLWDIGSDPIENLTELLEEKGVKVGLVEGPDSFDACTFVTEEDEPVIVINRSMSGDRQRFSLAHELGHIVIEPVNGVDPEKVAHRFAGAFLAPAEAVRRELGGHRRTLSIYELHLLKHKYGLSMQAWIYRAKDLGVLSESSARNLFRQFRLKGWYRKEPGDSLPVEEPKRFERLIMRALSEELISESRAAELLGKPFAEFWREVAEKHDGLPADFGS